MNNKKHEWLSILLFSLYGLSLIIHAQRGIYVSIFLNCLFMFAVLPLIAIIAPPWNTQALRERLKFFVTDYTFVAFPWALALIAVYFIQGKI